MDTLDPSNLSELESLSDSDWLDISSRASGDTDSVTGFDDSDREDVDNRPSSRRSFSSIDSSRDGDVQGWEGLAEDGFDESPPGECLLHVDTVSLSSRLAALSSASVPFHKDDEDPEEEQRVKDALDQSMMSTLSSSRSNSLNASVQTSIVHSRDLRLSFPDPLTSSCDEHMNTSYEDVSVPSDPVTTAPDAEADTLLPSVTELIATTLAPSAADPGSVAIPEVPQEDVFEAGQAKTSPDFYVVLYGVSPTTKWSLVDKLLEKIAHGTSMTLSSDFMEQDNAFPHVSFVPRGESREKRVVSIVDRTDLLKGGDNSSYVSLDRPSLAIVFLPATVLNLPEHTLYLPMLAQSFSVVDLPYCPDHLLDAEQQWETCGIPHSKVVRLARGSSSVVEPDEVERARPLQVARALRPVLAMEVSTSMQRLRSAHALTIFAVLSIVLGCVIKGSLTQSTATYLPQQQQTSSLWGLLRPPTAPVTSSSPANHSNALASSSLKDFALAVLPPAPSVATTSASRLSSTATGVANHAVLTGAPSECNCGCGLITWPGKYELSNELALRPTPSVPSLRAEERSKVGLSFMSTQPQGKGKGRIPADGSLYELSTRIAGALSEYFDIGTVVAVVHKEFQDIFDALDELVDAIRRQTASAWDQSRGIVRSLQEQMEQRHVRARNRARELKDMGGRLMSTVGDHVRERTGLAKKTARALRDSVVAMDTWKTARERRIEAMKVRKMGRERRLQRQGRMRRALKH
ncbi:hypothetical protein SCP_1202370 [Sparassis crispa]|uniref:Uncharacterized protein n=1 Tax=Sparassis crispa TaxID=139825 RepID=A0A401H0R1_9APHY|nr:hypothetical protein SCP_1202370 [Sparassis crispa]GBE88011.1 hypothetical protein SCP_1202370 [Sparassis crispa]